MSVTKGLAGGQGVKFEITTAAERAEIVALGWDTEGGDRAKLNLLRDGEPASISVLVSGDWHQGKDLATTVSHTGAGLTSYSLAVAPDAELVYSVVQSGDTLEFAFSATGPGADTIEQVKMEFPFSPLATATTVLPAKWNPDSSFPMPALISAPDCGQMMLSATPETAVVGSIVGDRTNHKVDFSVTLQGPFYPQEARLTLKPVILPTPDGLNDERLWRAARRGWFNVFQPTATWGNSADPVSAPTGILANNVVSDVVSCLIHVWADAAYLTPDFSKDVKMGDFVRRTIDFWLENRMKPSGEIYAYWGHADMLDANASPLISAWDYVDSSNDNKWLENRIEKLEKAADYLILRDTDNDGIIESTHSGNYGTLIEPMRADSAWDTINAGNKNAYCNALIYRAFRCMADLEKRLGRSAQQAKYQTRAHRLKEHYYATFYNPESGWLAWWISSDGEMHDLSSPMISSIAVSYGLLEPKEARQVMGRLWEKIEQVGFKRFDLGVPITLVPVRRGDYLMGLAPGVCGIPANEDGSDEFGRYLNGGCCVLDAVHFIVAMHTVGETAKGDKVLNAMLERQEQGSFPNGGGFQNGIVNDYPSGAEFFTWDGRTCGYEGHLTYSWAFLQSIFLRQPEYRNRLFRPLQ